MRVAVAGSSGFIGSALVERLGADGHEVVRLVRGEPDGPGQVRWDPAAGSLDPAALAGCHGVVNLAGAGIGDKRWNPAYKELLRSSRIPGTRLLAETLAQMARTGGGPPPVFVSGSAIGYYGSRGDEELTESSDRGEDFLAGVVGDWEAATEAAADAGVRVVHLRTGLVLGKGQGLLAKMVPPARLGLGGRLGSGRQWMSWISITDEVSVIVAALTDARWSGPVNSCAPQPVTNADFTAELGRALHRPMFMAVPAPALRLALGAEMADSTVLASQRVRPAALVQGGFVHADPELGATLEAVLA